MVSDTLPQHFNTSDGHYEGGKQCLLKQLKSGKGSAIQQYNNATESLFSTFCNAEEDCSRRHERTCTVNRTSTEYRTVYKHLVDNNCTERLERYRGHSTVSGRILRWNIADLFDVPQWHYDNGDCSHFCYIPPLYEAAFERLDLLLPPFE